MQESTAKRAEQRDTVAAFKQAAKLTEVTSAATTNDVLNLVTEIIEDLGATPEKICLTRDGQSITIANKTRRAARNLTEIETEVADGRTRLVVFCSGSVGLELKNDIEAILQVGALSAELCARRLWQPAPEVTQQTNQNEGLLGESVSMQLFTTKIERMAQSDSPALITGERGTGKTTAAAAVHNNSRRAGKPFIDLDCTSIVDNLLESELFGHERGAFTGADKVKRGLFEEANGGTLFLDEIAELPLTMQVKLLKAIEQQKIRRVGATKDLKIDVRIIAATSKDLGAMKNEGLFREDLFDRLSVLEIRTCPLREKPEDIPVIIFHQLKEEERKAGRDKPYEIEEAAVQLLQSYTWPGNIRELKNFVTRLTVNSSGEAPIAVEDVRSQMGLRQMIATCIAPDAERADELAQVEDEPSIEGPLLLPDDIRLHHPEESLNHHLARITETLIESVIARNHGNISKAAREIGLHRNTLKFRLAHAKKIIAQAA